MDDFSRKFRSIDWKGLQRSARKMQASTASALKDMVMTDLENKTRAATADTSWGASGTDLMAIAQGTYNRDDYALIMSIVWQRLGSSRWRCVYKGLEVLKFLIMHGTARCTEEARGALGHLQSLQHYRAVSQGKDVGEGVRMRATLVCEMLSDQVVLDEEREKSRHLRSKLSGGFDMHGGGASLSSEDYRYGNRASDSASVHTTGTASYKGYGDDGGYKGYGDDSTGGYDDEPTGSFAKKAEAAAAASGAALTEKPNVDDLLGGGEEVQAEAGYGASVLEDTTGAGAASGGNDAIQDMFGALALVPSDESAMTPHATMPTSAAAPTAAGGAMKTSELVAALAAQRTAPAAPAPTSSNVNVADAGNGGNIWADIDSMPTPAAPSSTPAPLKVAPPLKRREDPDPFGGLLDTAKKTGVL